MTHILINILIMDNKNLGTLIQESNSILSSMPNADVSEYTRRIAEIQYIITKLKNEGVINIVSLKHLSYKKIIQKIEL